MRQSLIERMLYIVLALVFVIAGLSAYFAVQAIDKFTQQQEVLQQQVAGQKEVLKGMQELLANQGKTTQDINKSLSCILIFFSSPDRTNYYISDFATCTITNTLTGITEKLPLPVASATPQPQTTPPARPVTQASNPSQGSAQKTPSQPSSSTPAKPVATPPQKSVFQNALDVMVKGVNNVIGAIKHLGGL